MDSGLNPSFEGKSGGPEAYHLSPIPRGILTCERERDTAPFLVLTARIGLRRSAFDSTGNALDSVS